MTTTNKTKWGVNNRIDSQGAQGSFQEPGVTVLPIETVNVGKGITRKVGGTKNLRKKKKKKKNKQTRL